jgi:hypothetical protein
MIKITIVQPCIVTPEGVLKQTKNLGISTLQMMKKLGISGPE